MDLAHIGDITTIDWHRDDGVNLDMINDLTRNRFYDAVIRTGMQGSRAVDIGFGTGLLTMLALKHGAQHVTAYESDAHRWRLGTRIIQDLGLEHRVDLRWSRFHSSDIQEFPDHIFFTETVNGNLFQEGLWQSLPQDINVDFRPGCYELDIYALRIPQQVAARLGQAVTNPGFHPGVDTWPGFVDRVNHYRGSPSQPLAQLTSGLNYFEQHCDTVWGWLPHIMMARDSRPAAGYSIDVSQNTVMTWNQHRTQACTRDADITNITVDVPVAAMGDGCVLLVPRASMSHNQSKLYLDQSHWGPMQHPVVVQDFTGVVTVCHDVRTGDISYSLC